MSNSVAECKNRSERLRIFIRMLKQNAYPNFTTLKKRFVEEYGDAYDESQVKPRDPNAEKTRGKYRFTRQTLYRDVAYLTSLGAVIKYDKEKNGYLLENTNWNGYASFLREDEMEAAVLGAQFAERILPPSVIREKIRGSVDSLWAEHFLPNEYTEVQWNSLVIQGLPVKINSDVFQIIFEQWRSQHDVDITYTSVGCSTEKKVTIEPHVLSFCNGTWYVRGRVISPEYQEFRTFALHRISTAKRNGTSFTPDMKEIASVNSGKTFDFPRYKDVKLKVRGMALRRALESLPVEDVVYPTTDCAEISLKEIEEYKVTNFVLVSEGEAEILAPDELKARALEKAQAVVKCLE